MEPRNSSLWDQFRINAICSNPILAASPNLVRQETLFPPRELTKTEHSIAMRHLIALNIISQGIKPAIILEDDALIAHSSLMNQLLHVFRSSIKDNIFYDLCDNYMPSRQDRSKEVFFGGVKFTVTPIGITRTLMAYALSPKSAQRIVDSLSLYSLPIDMQIQIQLTKLLMPGASIVSSPFIHGSKSGSFSSSVHQF